MLVKCFVVKFLSKNKNVNVNTFYKELGTNIPKYLPYEGPMDGCAYLFCTKNEVDVIQICEKYNIKHPYIFLEDIEEEKFNNEYTIHPRYTKDPPHYELRKDNI